jgi:hypothetical protein
MKSALRGCAMNGLIRRNKSRRFIPVNALLLGRGSAQNSLTELSGGQREPAPARGELRPSSKESPRAEAIHAALRRQAGIRSINDWQIWPAMSVSGQPRRSDRGLITSGLQPTDIAKRERRFRKMPARKLATF